MAANDTQIGGDHYKKGGEEHWDRAWRLKYDCFQYIITKWVERWKEKGGVQDLMKARHALDKYIEVVQNTPVGSSMEYSMAPGVSLPHQFNPLVKPTGKVAMGKFCTCDVDPSTCGLHEEGGPTASYVNQG